MEVNAGMSREEARGVNAREKAKNGRMTEQEKL